MFSINPSQGVPWLINKAKVSDKPFSTCAYGLMKCPGGPKGGASRVLYLGNNAHFLSKIIKVLCKVEIGYSGKRTATFL